MERIAVVGSREFDDYAFMCVTLDAIRPWSWVLISGGAKGADSLANHYANTHTSRVTYRMIIFPDWDTHGKSAGFIRNQQIVDACDRVIAFWDGKSKGTKDTIDKAIKAGKRVDIHIPSV